jgi:hypothetical protein
VDDAAIERWLDTHTGNGPTNKELAQWMRRRYNDAEDGGSERQDRWIGAALSLANRIIKEG